MPGLGWGRAGGAAPWQGVGPIGMNDIIRRKVAQAARTGGEGGSPGADHGWRLAFARAARDCTGLLVEVASMQLNRRSLAEVLELPPDRALLVLLDGPEAGLGLMAVSAEVMAALIEMQTTGRVASSPPLPRRPTRTDAAMVANTIDRALEELDSLLAEEEDLTWAGGFRYASFLEDPRPLGLLLEDQPYRVLTADLALADGARRGGLILALPAEGRGQRLLRRPVARPEKEPAGPGFSAVLGEAVMASSCTLQAVIGRISLPLQQVMALQVDQILPLPDAALDRIGLETPDGRWLARARLGQNKGLRALRLEGEEASDAPTAVTTLPVAAGSGEGADAFAGFAAALDMGDGLLAAG